MYLCVFVLCVRVCVCVCVFPLQRLFRFSSADSGFVAACMSHRPWTVQEEGTDLNIDQSETELHNGDVCLFLCLTTLNSSLQHYYRVNIRTLTSMQGVFVRTSNITQCLCEFVLVCTCVCVQECVCLSELRDQPALVKVRVEVWGHK